MTTTKIGVFDSGMGGLSVASAIQHALPDSNVVFANDVSHVPYGSKPMEEVYSYAKPIIQGLVDEGCDIIVIACNTVTTNLITRLREDFDLPLIGMEPMIKPAAEQTETKVIAVCATPATLASDRYAHLKSKYAANIKVIEPDCSTWSAMIESSEINYDFIRSQIQSVCEEGVDIIVLGCTHYHWIEEDILQATEGRAKVLQPEVPVIAELKRVISQLY